MVRKLCPKCGSDNITEYAGRIFGEQSVNRNTCKECGYSGFMPDVDDDMVEEFRKEIKNKKVSE